MANSEVYPSSLFPLRGDLSAESGATTVEVIGLQTIPIAPNPYTDKAVPTYVLSNDDIEWITNRGRWIERDLRKWESGKPRCIDSCEQ